MARFGAVVTAMVTPFDDDGALDLDAAAVLARWLADHGSDALVVAGTTGEAPVLSDEERCDLWRAVAEAVTIPVIAGAGTNDTAHSVDLTERATACGVAGILAVTPYYNRPPQSGIEAHFRAMAAATHLPVLLYDIPVRTGRRIAPEVILRLGREVPNIVGVKDATGDVAGAARWIAAAPPGFECYSGNDDQTLPLLAVGAVGVVSVASHWAGQEIGEMIAAFGKGDVETARHLNARLIESWEFQTSDAAPNPIPTKAMMRTLGLRVGQCRLPLGPAPEGLEERARQVWHNLHPDA
ncbi:MAG: 4-hydroxy-tetrahydrodipicolinate synthase [Acidimicrobiia bacterium]